MAGFYRPRHPERTVLYRVLSHHFERFLAAYERCFEEEYGYFRRNVREVVERYLDCANPLPRALPGSGVRTQAPISGAVDIAARSAI